VAKATTTGQEKATNAGNNKSDDHTEAAGGSRQDGAGKGSPQGSEDEGVADWFASAGSIFGVLAGLGIVVAALRKSLGAFRGMPTGFLTGFWRGISVRDFKTQTGFRHRFAEEFRLVTQALHPRSMLILIDDLDRCRPEKVLEVLEAINFLTTSGECFVVLGMARERVEGCVGHEFKDLAEDLVEYTENKPGVKLVTDAPRRRRVEFARQYLEKLINIEVPVPAASHLQTRELLAPEAIEEKGSSRGRGWISEVGRQTRFLGPWLLVLFVIVGGFYLGTTILREDNSSSSDSTSDTQTKGQGVGKGATPSEVEKPSKITPEDSRTSTGFVSTSQDRAVSSIWLVLPLGLLVGGAFWILSSPPDLVVKDSEVFRDALVTWHPLIVARHSTPRSVKRFLNRIRYFAMLQRPNVPAQSLGLRLLAAFTSSVSADQVVMNRGTDNPSEMILVALGAIHHSYPEWLSDERLFDDFVVYLRDQPALPLELRERLDTFGSWGSLRSYREPFMRLVKGITVS